MKLAIAPEPEPTCTFAEMLPLLASLFDPEPTRITALTGRAKRFMTMGAASCPGRGSVGRYGAGEVRRVLIAMELHQMGLAPEKAIALLNEHDPRFGGSARIGVGSLFSYIDIDMDGLRMAAQQHLPHMFGGAS